MNRQFYVFALKFDRNDNYSYVGIDKLGFFSFKSLIQYLNNIDTNLKCNLSEFSCIGSSQVLTFDNSEQNDNVIEYHITKII